jgi:hypothetical protein
MPMTTGNRTHDRRGQYPPVFAAWLAIRYRGPVCERWRSFPSFYLDVGPRPSWRHLLIRNDTAGDFDRAMPAGGLRRGIDVRDQHDGWP